MLKKVNSIMYCMRNLGPFGVNSDIIVTFHNAVICSIITFGSIFWGGSISKLDRGRLEKNVKKQFLLWESHWTVLRLCMKRNCIEN